MDDLTAFISGRITLKTIDNNRDDINKGNSFMIKHIICSTANKE